jgi:O-antigen ligase
MSDFKVIPHGDRGGLGHQIARTRRPILAVAATSLLLLYCIMQGDAFLFRLGVLSMAPFLQIAIALALVTVIWASCARNKSIHIISGATLALLLCLAAYVITQVVSLATWESLPAERHILAYWIYSGGLLLMGLLAGLTIGSRANQVFFIILIIFVGTVAIDTLFETISDSAVAGRSASTLRNSNEAATAIVLLMLGTVRWRRVTMIELASLGLGGLGVALTQSRGGMVAIALLVGCMLIWQMLSRTSKSRLLVPAIVAIAAATLSTAILIYRRYGIDAFAAAGSATSNGSLTDVPARTEGMYASWALITESPFLGHGTGFAYTMDVGPHNMFLRSWVEAGIPGLLAYTALLGGVALFGTIRRDPCILTLAVLLTAISFTSHNLTEARSALLIIGVLFANAAGGRTYGSMRLTRLTQACVADTAPHHCK